MKRAWPFRRNYINRNSRITCIFMLHLYGIRQGTKSLGENNFLPKHKLSQIRQQIPGKAHIPPNLRSSTIKREGGGGGGWGLESKFQGKAKESPSRLLRTRNSASNSCAREISFFPLTEPLARRKAGSNKSITFGT